MLIGPATVAALAIVIPAVLPALPSVRPPKVEAKVQPVVEKALVKLVDAGSIRRVPVPLKPLVDLVGALFCSTSVPVEMVVAPE